MPATLAVEAALKTCTAATAKEAIKAPLKLPRPPMTMMTKARPVTLAAMAGSMTNRLPPSTPAKPAKAQLAPNTSACTRGKGTPSAPTMAGFDKAARNTSPTRVARKTIASTISTPSAIATLAARVTPICTPSTDQFVCAQAAGV